MPIRELAKTKKGNNTEADWSSEGPGRFLVCPRRTEQINTSPLALIHPIADNNNSRKLTLKIVQPYTLGPGRKGPFAPVAYLRSRHLDTPPHKNSLAVSEKAAYRKPKYVLRVTPSGLLLAPVLGLEPPKSTTTSGQGRTLKGFDLARCLTAPHGEGEITYFPDSPASDN